MGRKPLVLLVGALLVLGLTAGPTAAAPPPVIVADPRSDGRGPGDVRAVRLDRFGNTFVFQVRTHDPLDVYGSRAWRRAASATELRYNVDIGNGPGIDYAVIVEPSPTGAVVDIQSFLPDHGTPRACDITLDQPNSILIRVRVSNSCIGEPARIRTWARYRLDQGGDGSVNSTDRAPNAGFSGFMDYVDD